MQNKNGMRIAIIGAGISGIATANILKKNGFEAIIFEKSENIGGVWASAYPEVHLQNIYTQYHLSDFDWPFKPDLHPTGGQIMKYLTEAVDHLKLDIRLKHEILEMKEQRMDGLSATRIRKVFTKNRLDTRSLQQVNIQTERTIHNFLIRNSSKEKSSPSAMSPRWIFLEGRAWLSLATVRAHWIWQLWQQNEAHRSIMSFVHPAG